MKISELITEGRGNRGPRGKNATIRYLEALPSTMLDRTYIHTSDILKVGIKPGGNLADPSRLEPVGIYTYGARYWLKIKGNTPYSARRYLHVISCKERTKQASLEETARLIQNFQEKHPDNATGASSQLTSYLRKQGYGLVTMEWERSIEHVILGREFISGIETFDSYHPVPGARVWQDDFAPNPGFDYSLARTGLDIHKEWLKANPDVARRLELGWVIGVDDPEIMYHVDPRELAQTRMVVHALRSGIDLSSEQKSKLGRSLRAAYRELQDLPMKKIPSRK